MRTLFEVQQRLSKTGVKIKTCRLDTQLSTMPYSEYLKRRAIVHCDRGLTAPAIMDALAEEGLQATRQGIAKFLKWYARTHSFARAPGTTSVPRPHCERTSTAPREYLDCTTSVPRPHHERPQPYHESTSTAPQAYHDHTSNTP